MAFTSLESLTLGPNVILSLDSAYERHLVNKLRHLQLSFDVDRIDPESLSRLTVLLPHLSSVNSGA